jgi:SanA protein
MIRLARVLTAKHGRQVAVRWGPLVPIIGGTSLAAILLLSGLGATRWWTDRETRGRIYALDAVPARPVAIVFGAGVWPDGRLSDVLADRVETAVELYRRGKVQKLLMTGDNRFTHYNEPQRMYEYAVAHGVPGQDIVLDYAGRRTYDSCYRARAIFRVSEAILVTQAYHMDRALFTANHVGLDAVGVNADRRQYVYIRWYWLREALATPLAWWQVLVTRPQPVMGEPLPIFPAEP